MTFYEKQIHAHLKSLAPVKCETPNCSNVRASFVQRRLRKDGVWVEQKKTYRYCWKCHSREFKRRCPESYVLNTVRKNARARGIPCTLTSAEFRRFCAETGYAQRKGKRAEDLTIDRIDHDKGYHIWNIRVLSHAENSTQGHVAPGAAKQNERKPTEWEYDFDGPDPEYIPPTNKNSPF